MQTRPLIPEPASSSFALQSTLNHIALIMDGNRRWARGRNVPGSAGHEAGLDRLIKLLPELESSGARTVTVFAFSAANWRRHSTEVRRLFQLAESALQRLTPECIERGIRVSVIGRRDRLPRSLLTAADRTALLTANGTRELRVALDYSSRQSILEAARALPPSGSMTELEALLGLDGTTTQVDLLIRTGKEQRLSDFLLWESAFAELYFADCHWPDFTAAELRRAIAWYHQRQRRFGA